VLHLAHRAILRINFEFFIVFILSRSRAHYISGHPRDLPDRIGMRDTCSPLVLDDVDLRRVITSCVPLLSQLIDVQADSIPERSFENTLVHSRAPLVYVGTCLEEPDLSTALIPLHQGELSMGIFSGELILQGVLGILVGDSIGGATKEPVWMGEDEKFLILPEAPIRTGLPARIPELRVRSLPFLPQFVSASLEAPPVKNLGGIHTGGASIPSPTRGVNAAGLHVVDLVRACCPPPQLEGRIILGGERIDIERFHGSALRNDSDTEYFTPFTPRTV
jgi:hypothetical protein